MRAGPLSSPKIISLLNHYFVPVFATNEDYESGGSAPPLEKAEYSRIFEEAKKAGLSVGTVHVYVLAPDGKPLDSLHVKDAADESRLAALLNSTAAGLGTIKGTALVPPAPTSVPLRVEPGSLVLHLTARGFKRGTWREFPAEDWVVLGREDWGKLLKSGEYAPGSSWDADVDVTARLFRHFYPQSENNDVSTNRIERQLLKARVLSVKDGVVRIRLDGLLRMKHSFYEDRIDGVVDARVAGFMDVDSADPRILRFRLVTVEAAYAGEAFGVAVRSRSF
jgi:hypothetical protein